VGIGAGTAVLIVSLGVHISQWNEIPLWHHLIFLVLLIPLCIAGTDPPAQRKSILLSGTPERAVRPKECIPWVA
jgi:hypothetical protein